MKINIFKEKILLIFTILSAALLVFTLAMIYFNAGRLSSPIVLHFDKFRGVDFLGAAKNLWWIWLTGFLSVLINVLLAETLFYRERALTYLLSGSGLLLSLFLLILLATIISVN